MNIIEKHTKGRNIYDDNVFNPVIYRGKRAPHTLRVLEYNTKEKK